MANSQLFKRLLIVAAVIVCILLLTIILVGSLTGTPSTKYPSSKPEVHPLLTSSVLGKYQSAAVSSDIQACSDIGSSMLSRNGTAVDAAVAVLFCLGAAHPQSSGIGGGFLMTIYRRTTKEVFTLDAREVAPNRATEDMFGGDGAKSQRGPLAVAVPGELMGLWEAHQRFGQIPWKEIIQPSINILKMGYIVSNHMASALNSSKKYILTNPTLRDIFVQPGTENVWSKGANITNERLATTYEKIAEHGAYDLYNGTLAKDFLRDLKEAGTIIEDQDLSNYTVKWREPVTATLGSDLHLYSMGPPGSGAILTFILQILDGYKFDNLSVSDLSRTIQTFHRTIEAFKFAYAKRGHLADPDFVDVSMLIKNLTSKEYADNIRRRISDTATSKDPSYYDAVTMQSDDHGTTHVSILSPDGDAVAVTSTVNFYFGAGIASPSTGIILNNAMDDFSSPNITNFFGVPPASANFIRPGKRPLSSMSPTIITDNIGNVRLILGAAGGTQIPTAITQVIMRNLWFGEDIKDAIDVKRFHHQLFPMRVTYEQGLPKEYVDGLLDLGHQVQILNGSGSVICAISKTDAGLEANADFRKRGGVAGF